jgi:general secretion pathway protein E
MPMKAFTTDFVCEALQEQHLIDKTTARKIRLREKEQRARLRRKGASNGTSQISPVDIISSMELHSSKQSDQIISEELIMKTLASYWKLPFLKIDFSKLKPCVDLSKLSEPFIRKHLLVPVSTSETMLFVAMVNPMNIEALEAIKQVSDLQVRPVVSTKSDILKAIDRCYRVSKSAEESSKQKAAFQQSIAAAEKVMSPRQAAEHASKAPSKPVDEKHIVNSVNLLLNYAFEQRTSEVHIEPKHDYSAIRFRIDGILYDVKRIPLEIHAGMIQRLKVLAGMNISERRKPQDGRTQFSFHAREIHLRISTMPVAFGEKAVLRLFDPITLFRHIDDLGFSAEELAQYMSFISRSSGIILLTGPAGSGKTTTLYSTLNQLSERGINISTIEEPIESVHEGFNQVSVKPTVGVTFEVAIRHIVRQSPDVIMIGEMRDKDSVEHTMQAALTGHLILTTLHTHDAPSALVRLINMGTRAALVESTVIAVIAQRLIRKVCDHCAKPYQLSPQELDHFQFSPEDAAKLNLRKGEGCTICRGTGYRGQNAIFEIMEMTDRIGALIRKGAGAQALKNAAMKMGMHCLRDKAVEKMREGITTSEEVLRVTGGLKGGLPHQFKSKASLLAA